MEQKERVIRLKLPFNLEDVNHPESYLDAMTECIQEADEMSAFNVDSRFYLEYGEIDSVHILYFGICDLGIMMTPELGKWRAQRVYLSHMDGIEKIYTEKQAMKKLFSYSNPHIGEKNDGECSWSPEVGVFVDAPLTNLAH